jgi:hypothetical protein
MLYSPGVPQYGPLLASGGGGGVGVGVGGDGWVEVSMVSGSVVGWLHYGVRTSDVIEYFGAPWAMPR